MLKHCLSLETIISNFIAFFVSLGFVISCICKMSFSVTSAKQEFTLASHCFIIHLPGGGQCPLVAVRTELVITCVTSSVSFVWIVFLVKKRLDRFKRLDRLNDRSF